MRIWTLSTVVGVLLAACANGGSGGQVVEAGVEAVAIDDVWVFQHKPESAMDALHSGAPEIIDGCLMIDNTVVVWHADRLDEAAAAVAAAKSGAKPQLLISGGGLSTAEGADPATIPTIITDRCPTTAVWFGAP